MIKFYLPLENVLKKLKQTRNELLNDLNDFNKQKCFDKKIWNAYYESMLEIQDKLSFVFPDVNPAYKVNPADVTSVINPNLLSKKPSVNSAEELREIVMDYTKKINDVSNEMAKYGAVPPPYLRHKNLQAFWTAYLTATLSCTPFEVSPPMLNMTGTLVYTDTKVEYNPVIANTLPLVVERNLDMILPQTPNNNFPVVVNFVEKKTYNLYSLFMDRNIDRGFEIYNRTILYSFFGVFIKAFNMLVYTTAVNTATGVSTPMPPLPATLGLSEV